MSTIGPLRRSPRFPPAPASPSRFAQSPSQSLPHSPMMTSSMNDNDNHSHSHNHQTSSSPPLSPLSRSMNESDFLNITSNSDEQNHSSPLSPALGAMGFMKAMNKPPISAGSRRQSQRNHNNHNNSMNEGFSLLNNSSPLSNSAPSPNFGFEPSPLESPAMIPIHHTQSQSQPSALNVPPPMTSARKGAGSRRMSAFLSSPSPMFSAPAPPRRSPRFAPNSNFLTGMSPGFFSSPNLSFSLPSPSFTPLTRAAMDSHMGIRRSPRLASHKHQGGASSPNLSHSHHHQSSFIPPSPFQTHDANSSANLRSMTASPNNNLLNSNGPQTPIFPPLEDSAVHHDDHSPSRSNRSILSTMHSNYYSSSTSQANEGNLNLNQTRKRRRSSVDSKSLAVMPQFTPELTSLNPFYVTGHTNDGNNATVGYTLDMNGGLTGMSPSLPSLAPYNGNNQNHNDNNDNNNNNNNNVNGTNRPSTPSSTPGSLSSGMSSSSGSLSGASTLNLPSATNGASAAGSGNGSGSSCHQCKSRRSFQNLIFCANMFLAQARYKHAREVAASSGHVGPPPKLDKKSICRKKYCETCLLKFYGERPPVPTLRQSPQSTWICPACRDICCCAACRRQKFKHRMAAAGITVEGNNIPNNINSNNLTVSDIGYQIDVDQIPNMPANQVLALAIVHLPQWNSKFVKQQKKTKIKTDKIETATIATTQPDIKITALLDSKSKSNDNNESMTDINDSNNKDFKLRRKSSKKDKKEKKKENRKKREKDKISNFDSNNSNNGEIRLKNENEEKENNNFTNFSSSFNQFNNNSTINNNNQSFINNNNLNDSSSSALESGSENENDNDGNTNGSSSLSLNSSSSRTIKHEGNESSSSGMDDSEED